MKKRSKICIAALLALCVGIGLKARAQSTRDFGNCACFAADNAALGEPKKGEKRVVFFGNSITQGWINIHPDFFKKNGYVNRGIGGQSTYNFLARFRSDVLDLKPAVVVILGGTNDVAENTCVYNEDCTVNNIKSMVELAKLHKIKVILCSVVPSKQFGWRKTITDAPVKIDKLNKRLKAYAEEADITFADYFSALVDKDGESQRPEWTRDGVHPNASGYDVLESVIVPIINKVL